jgi:predicted nucleic acid-binding protein
MILVDTNVILDVVGKDPIWADWSRLQLNASALQDAIGINEIVYAELSVGYRRYQDLDEFIARAGLVLIATPRPALFLSGKAFQRYRRTGGVKNGVLSDFLIGAHAIVTNSPLITRDPRRYRSYFPGIALITPNVNQNAAQESRVITPTDC